MRNNNKHILSPGDIICFERFVSGEKHIGIITRYIEHHFDQDVGQGTGKKKYYIVLWLSENPLSCSIKTSMIEQSHMKSPLIIKVV